MKFSKFISIAVLAARGASATPFVLKATFPEYVGGNFSGSPLQNASINANHLALYIGIPTTLGPPPSDVSASSYTNTTSFNLAADGTLYMNSAVTGSQILYIVDDIIGTPQITPAHTNFIPEGGVSNFTISKGDQPTLSFADGTRTPYACLNNPSFEVTLSKVPRTANCLELGLSVFYQGNDDAGGWQYI